jgi:hypothetical protein
VALISLENRWVAAVVSRAAQASALQGHPVAPKIIFTDRFGRRDGIWRAGASQRTAAN